MDSSVKPAGTRSGAALRCVTSVEKYMEVIERCGEKSQPPRQPLDFEKEEAGV